MMRMGPPPGAGPGGPMGGALSGGAGGGDGGPVMNPQEGEVAGIFTAIQEQLGLKLEQKKGALDVLVIEHSEREPVDN